MNTLHQSGDVIRNRYRIVKCLGEGGMGTTYAAEDLLSSKRVAIKVLSLRRMTDWKVLELFERESRILENLHHPAIPAYLEHFQVDAPEDLFFYLVQELAEGETLSALVERGWRGSEAEVKEIASQVLEILKYLQRLTPPVIHRDIKPQNIIRRPDGHIVLVDFGAVGAAYRNTVTAGTFVGTFGYMAPEQFRGQAFLATDLYGLGTTLLYLLTHQSPADLPQSRMKIEFRDRIQVSPAFANWLEKVLEPVAEDRFSSAAEALDALQNGYQNRYQDQFQDRGAIASTPTPSSQLAPPKGSRIVVQESRDRLLIDIPAAGFLNPTTLFLGGFALFWNGFLVIWTGGAMMAAAAGAWFFPLFSIPFWCVGLSVLWTAVFAAVGSSSLELDRRSFQLSWQCLGFKGQKQGQTADLNKAEVEVQVSSKGNRTTYVTLWEGVKKHRLPSQLSPVEQEWLVHKVSTFLHRLG